MSIRVLLAEDQALVRAGFRGLLDRSHDIEVVGEATNGADAVRIARSVHPDIILMDIRMPIMDGLEATRRIVADEQLSAVRVIVLTTFDLDEYVFEALRVGASGFLIKDIEPDDLRQAVRVVAAGEALLSPRVTRRLITQFVAQLPQPPKDPEQLAALTHGLSNQEIGSRLAMSPATAKTHISRAMLKLGARDRAQLVVLAYQTGLVTPDAHLPH
jgi:DNA-binding NarL/FixJ family response regulator